MKHSRRNFFALAAGGALVVQSRAQSPGDVVKQGMIVRAARPEDLEMPLSGFSDYITPVEHFFVRTHVYVPTVDLSKWQLEVGGNVATPLTLTMAELRRMPSVELIAVQECAGNGRAFFDPPVAGMQWATGSVGNGRWRGVRLADLLKRAGIKASSVEVLFDGADVPIGTMPDFRRSITVKKALDQNTLLAYEMNGEALPVKHGFPLRVIAPGWASDSWVKWVTSVQVLDKEFDGFWMKSAYRRPDFPMAPGSSMPADQMKPVTSLHVKSVIASPRPGQIAMQGKPLSISGVAWSGDGGAVTSVQVSTDNGRNWKLAELTPNQFTQFGWRQWEISWTPRNVEYATVIVRASDASGNIQPFEQEWNPSGYGWNAAPRVGVTVLEKPPRDEMPPLPSIPTTGQALEQPKGFKEACLVCHGEDAIRQQRLTPAQWDREINKMTGWGAQVKAEDRAGFLDYLEKSFGPHK
jgi:DMSO/TMAO reductase YedYZ molybdopterin-dependent catalytic subunit